MDLEKALEAIGGREGVLKQIFDTGIIPEESRQYVYMDGYNFWISPTAPNKEELAEQIGKSLEMCLKESINANRRSLDEMIEPDNIIKVLIDLTHITEEDGKYMNIAPVEGLPKNKVGISISDECPYKADLEVKIKEAIEYLNRMRDEIKSMVDSSDDLLNDVE